MINLGMLILVFFANRISVVGDRFATGFRFYWPSYIPISISLSFNLLVSDSMTHPSYELVCHSIRFVGHSTDEIIMSFDWYIGWLITWLIDLYIMYWFGDMLSIDGLTDLYIEYVLI